MGIDGLLNLVKSVTKRQHISSFRDKTIGIDALPWLYKGCYATPYQSKDDKDSLHFLYYMMEMIDILKYYNIKPIIVFDGRSLRMKKDTNQKRSKTKQDNRQKGLQLLQKGQYEEAKKFLSRCIIIDQRIISTTMRALKAKNVDFIVAPYQADTQLAKLKKLNIIDAAISQDSDLLVYGINVLFKLNQNGDCDYVDLQSCNKNDADNQFLKLFLQFSYELRVDSAILAGCDYSQSIHGIGIKRAIKLLHKQQNILNVIKKLRTQRVYKEKIPQNYQQVVYQVKLIFHLATTYNSIQKKLESLNPQLIQKYKPQSMTMDQLYEFIGHHFDYTEEIKNGLIAIKDLNKRVLQPLIIHGDFTVNKENLDVHQQLNKKRRVEEQEQRKKKQQELEAKAKREKEQNQKNPQNKQAEDQDKNDNDNKGKKKPKVQKVELTQQQKAARKNEIKNRIFKLQNMMNSTVEIIEDNNQKDQKQCKIEQKIQQIQIEQEQESQLSPIPGLQILNPFGKISYMQTQFTIDDQKMGKKKRSKKQKMISKGFLKEQKIEEQQKTSSKQNKESQEQEQKSQQMIQQESNQIPGIQQLLK